MPFKHVAGVMLGLVLASSVAAALAGNGGQLTGGGLARVVHDGSLTGSGTSASALGVAASGVSAGSYTSANITVGADGRVTAAASGSSGVPTTRTITAGTGLAGGGDLSTDRTLSLANTAVTPGSYTATNLTVDAQGRLTAASSTSLAAIATSGSASDLTSGTLPAGRFPALTGDVTTSAGSLATAIASNAVTNAKLATMADGTVKANISGSTAAPSDVTIAALVGALGIRAGQYGDGSDGSATMDGSAAVPGTTRSGSTYTATRQVFFTDLTINSGVTFLPSGFPVWVRGTLTNNGDINANGLAASGRTGGAVTWTVGNATAFLPAGSGGGTGSLSGAAGGDGGASSNCQRDFSTTAAAGGAAGATGTGGGSGHGGGGGGGGPSLGGAAGAGGAITNIGTGQGDAHDRANAVTGRFQGSSLLCAGTGGGGGGGAGSSTGTGGGGGGGGGWVVVHAFALTGSGTYRAKGGACTVGQSGNGGGGAGGAGGVFVLDTTSSAPTIDVSGASGCAAVGTAGAGAAGGAGITIVLN